VNQCLYLFRRFINIAARTSPTNANTLSDKMQRYMFRKHPGLTGNDAADNSAQAVSKKDHAIVAGVIFIPKKVAVAVERSPANRPGTSRTDEAYYIRLVSPLWQ